MLSVKRCQMSVNSYWSYSAWASRFGESTRAANMRRSAVFRAGTGTSNRIGRLPLPLWGLHC